MREAAAATDGERGRECVFVRKAAFKSDLVKRDLSLESEFTLV